MAHKSSRRTNRMKSTRKAGSCWRTTRSSASALAPRRMAGGHREALPSRSGHHARHRQYPHPCRRHPVQGPHRGHQRGLYGLAFPMERFITRESMYSISMLGAMEAVKFGSTFIDDLYHFPNPTARVAEELGLRGIIAQKIYDPDLQNLHNNDYSSVPGQAVQKLQAKPLSLWRSRCSPSSWSISAASNPLPGPTFCRASSWPSSLWSSSSRRSRPSAGVLPM